MTRSFVLFVLLTGCSESAPAQEPFAPRSDPLTADELSRLDARGTTKSITMIARDVQGLSPARKAQAAESLRILSVNCPYTRSALQLPIALHKVVMGIPAESFDPLVRGDWEYLQKGLTTHVALLDTLDVDLQVPVPGDHLYGRAQGVIVDRRTLLASKDPILATSPLIEQIPSLAEQIDEPTMGLIDLHSDRMEEATGVGRPCPRGPWAILPGQPWTLGLQIGGWHDALRRVAPFAEDPNAKAQIHAMLEVLESYGDPPD